MTLCFFIIAAARHAKNRIAGKKPTKLLRTFSRFCIFLSPYAPPLADVRFEKSHDFAGTFCLQMPLGFVSYLCVRESCKKSLFTLKFAENNTNFSLAYTYSTAIGTHTVTFMNEYGQNPKHRRTRPKIAILICWLAASRMPAKNRDLHICWKEKNFFLSPRWIHWVLVLFYTCLFTNLSKITQHYA